ncbi:MAG: Glycerophosphodiester phosphodiesterase, partial [Thermoleophilia bacterium]|nr:Glycerophosphodiester phosphodiesterase [Thermoleophilia bacterium]
RRTPTATTAKPEPAKPAKTPASSPAPRRDAAEPRPRADARAGSDLIASRSKPRPTQPSSTSTPSRADKFGAARPSATKSRPAAPTENYIDRATKDGSKLAVAHKGAGEKNVTTIEGMRAKAKAGIDPIEVKTSRTKDGVVVAYPGPVLGEGDATDPDSTKVADLTFRELRDNPAYEHIATLQETAKEATSLGVDLAISFDAHQSYAEQTAALEVLDRELPADRVQVFSRDAATQTALRIREPRRTVEPLPVDPATTPGETPHENSVDAIRKAGLDGATDAVEIDFQKLGDGTIVAFHDPTVDGIHLGTMDWSEFHDRYPDAPKLDEVATAVASFDELNIMADIKGPGYEVDVVEGLLERLPSERVSAFSFNREVVRTLDKRFPDVPVGYLPLQYDATSTAERLRQRFAGNAIDQLEDLGFTPDFIEVSTDNVNTEVLDWAGERDVPVLVGGTSSDLKIALADDPRVLGFMANNTLSVPGYVEADYDPAEHGEIPKPHDQSSFGGPVTRLLFNTGYEFLANNEYGQRATNLAVSGGGSALSGLKLLDPTLSEEERDDKEGSFAADAYDFTVTAQHEATETVEDVSNATGIGDGDDDWGWGR